MKRILVSAIALTLAGCATHPSRVKPADVDAQHYSAFDCAELATQADTTGTQLQRYVSSQRKARAVDSVMAIPVSKIFGKNKRNVRAIARYSGELAAIERMQAQKDCKVTT